MQLRNEPAKKFAELSILMALALIISYVESLISVFLPIPGIKLGLSNIVLVYVLYRYNYPIALGFGITKSVFSMIFLGKLSSVFYSLIGIILATTIMWILKQTKIFSLFGVNVCGAIFHIIGQILAATFVLGTVSVWVFLPILSCFSAICGVLTYLILIPVFRLQKINQ